MIAIINLNASARPDFIAWASMRCVVECNATPQDSPQQTTCIDSLDDRPLHSKELIIKVQGETGCEFFAFDILPHYSR